MGLNMGNQACSNTQNSSHNLADSNKNSYFAAVSSKLILGVFIFLTHVTPNPRTGMSFYGD